MMDVIDEKLTKGGYLRVGFESYALPDDPMTKAFNERSAWYAATGHQPGGRVNYVAVGSSSKVNLGDDYYAQNFYDIASYKKCLDKGKFPIFRGMKLSKDDAIRQHATQHIKSFLGIDFKYFKEEITREPEETLYYNHVTDDESDWNNRLIRCKLVHNWNEADTNNEEETQENGVNDQEEQSEEK